MFGRQRTLPHETRTTKRRSNERTRKLSEDPIEHKPARRHITSSVAFNRRMLRRVMIFASFCGVLYLFYAWAKGGDAARLVWQKESHWHESWSVVVFICPTDCSPPYREYSMRPHSPPSQGRSVLTNYLNSCLGPLGIPFQRPIEECRTFKSEQVEKLIVEVTKKMADKDLARLFENCFPNTLDTTVRWHAADPKHPQSFIITGDM